MSSIKIPIRFDSRDAVKRLKEELGKDLTISPEFLIDKDSTKKFVDALSGELKTALKSLENISLDLNKNIKPLSEKKNQRLKDTAGALKDLSVSLESLSNNSSATNILDGLSSLKISKSTLDNLKELPNILQEISKSVSSVEFGDIGKGNFSQINDLLKNAEQLKDLASILRSSKKDIEDAKRSTSSLENAYKGLSDTEAKYRILKNKERSGNLSSSREIIELEKLKSKRLEYISVIRKQRHETGGLTASEKETEREYLRYSNTVKDAIKREKELLNSKRSNKYGDVVATFNTNGINEARTYIKGITKDLNILNTVSEKTKPNGITEFSVKAKDANNQIRDLTYTFNNATGELHERTKILSSDVSKLASFTDSVKKKWKDLSAYILSFATFRQVWHILKEGLTIVKDLDTEFTNMQKVSNESVASLKRFANDSFEISQKIGATAKELQSSTADFMRLGYSLKEASKLAEHANVYANVGEMNIDDATKHMISSIAAFKDEFKRDVDASQALIDKYNEIGNNFAISSAEIGEGMERASAALVAAGANVDQALGLLTAGNVIQQDADSVANALKVVSLRIRGSKTELESMGESTDDLATSTSKLRKELKGLTGVDIMLNENTFKDPFEIFDELNKVWDKLSDTSQANVLEKLAGKTRSSVVAGLIKNMETARQVVETAQDSEGSAYRENERHLESIQGHIDVLTSKWEEFWAKPINRDFINGFLDLASGALELANNLGGVKTTLTSIVSLVASLKGVGRPKMFGLNKCYCF